MTHVKPGDLLFVYGTLMREIEDNEMASLLRDNSDHLGAARMRGRLYRITHYPGLVDSDDPAEIVHGDLFRLGPRAAEVMAALDLYEDIGPPFEAPYEYRRELREVASADGPVTAWVYVYNWDVDPNARIESGRFTA